MHLFLSGLAQTILLHALTMCLARISLQDLALECIFPRPRLTRSKWLEQQIIRPSVQDLIHHLPRYALCDQGVEVNNGHVWVNTRGVHRAGGSHDVVSLQVFMEP